MATFIKGCFDIALSLTKKYFYFGVVSSPDSSDLKQAFTQVVHHLDETRRLFSSVADNLRTSPGIGEDHRLYELWARVEQVEHIINMFGVI